MPFYLGSFLSDDEGEVELTCFQLPEEHSRSVCGQVDLDDLAADLADSLDECKRRRLGGRLLNSAEALIIPLGATTRSGACTNADLLGDILKEVGCV